MWNSVQTINSDYFCCSQSKELLGDQCWNWPGIYSRETKMLKTQHLSSEKAGFWGQAHLQRHTERCHSAEPGETDQTSSPPTSPFPWKIKAQQLSSGCRWDWGFSLTGDCHSMAEWGTCFRGIQYNVVSCQSAQRYSWVSHKPPKPGAAGSESLSRGSKWSHRLFQIMIRISSKLQHLPRHSIKQILVFSFYFLPHQQRNKHCFKEGK